MEEIRKCPECGAEKPDYALGKRPEYFLCVNTDCSLALAVHVRKESDLRDFLGNLAEAATTLEEMMEIALMGALIPEEELEKVSDILKRIVSKDMN